MIVTVYTRHSADCPKRNDSQWRRCKCPKWHYSSAWPRPQQSAKTRSWDEAELRARALEQGDRIPELSDRSTAAAVKAYLTDVESRNLSANYRAKLKRELNELAEWATAKPVHTMKHWTLTHLEEFRNTWKEGPVTRRKRQERMRSFFLYCVNHAWIQENPSRILSRIKVDQVPTDYFTRDEMKKIEGTIETFYPHGADREYRRARLRAMVMLMRWSGLRLGDAARLERHRLKDGKLMLYTQKTGTPVYVPLPPHVAEMLQDLPNSNPQYFFWSGKTILNNAGDEWWRTFSKILKRAALGKAAHPHMFRDTFAVELLLAGVPLDQVSILLGHSSVKITEKHYSPWVKARQEQLEQSVCKAWKVQNK
jgi:integrase/recombinase XerD